MYIVVVGAGRVGTRVVELALEDGHDVVVFDKNRDRCNAITKRLDAVAFNADATRESNLRDADVEEADAIIAATRLDPVNLMIMTLGQRLQVPKRVAVLNNPSSAPLFAARGAQVVGNPSRVAAEHLIHAARHAGVNKYVRVAGDVELFKAHVMKGSPIEGLALKDASIPHGVIVAALERKGRFVLPRGETTFLDGDIVTLLADEPMVNEAMAKFRPPEAEPGGA